MADARTQITIRFDTKLRGQIEWIAGREYRSVNQQIEKMLADAVARWLEANPGTELPQ